MNSRVESQNHSVSIPPPFDRKVSSSRVVLVLLLMLCLVLALNISYRLITQSEVDIVRYVVNNENLFLDESGQMELRRDLNARLAKFDAEIEQRVQPWQEDALAEIQENFQGAGEDYLDWYFSLTGSYTRLGVASMGDLEPWMEAQLQRRLVQPSGVEASFMALRENYEERLMEAEQAWLAETLTDLQQRYTPDAIMESEAENGRLATVDLDQLVEGVWQDQMALPRWSVTQVGGGLVGVRTGYSFAKHLAARPAMQAGRMIVHKFIARLGIQVVRSAAMGGTAAASASPTGPGAVLTGVVTVGASLAIAASSEFAALKAQEALQRPAMEAELHGAWNELELEAKRHLQAYKQIRSDAMLEHLERRAEEEMKRSELPETYRILG